MHISVENVFFRSTYRPNIAMVLSLASHLVSNFCPLLKILIHKQSVNRKTGKQKKNYKKAEEDGLLPERTSTV